MEPGNQINRIEKIMQANEVYRVTTLRKRMVTRLRKKDIKMEVGRKKKYMNTRHDQHTTKYHAIRQYQNDDQKREQETFGQFEEGLNSIRTICQKFGIKPCKKFDLNDEYNRNIIRYETYDDKEVKQRPAISRIR